MEKQNLQFEFKDIKAVKQDGEMFIEGYGSVFGNIDQHMDRIESGAFKESLGEMMPKMLWQHWSSEPIGTWVEAREDDRGLFLKGKLSDIKQGREAYELLKDGAISGLSIGFVMKDWDYEENIRVIKKVKLWEVSLVTFPANQEANVTAVKSEEIEQALTTARNTEKFLAKHGMSRKDATTVSSAIHAQLKSQRDSGDESQRDSVDDNAIEKLENLNNNLNEVISWLKN